MHIMHWSHALKPCPGDNYARRLISEVVVTMPGCPEVICLVAMPWFFHQQRLCFWGYALWLCPQVTCPVIMSSAGHAPRHNLLVAVFHLGHLTLCLGELAKAFISHQCSFREDEMHNRWANNSSVTLWSLCFNPCLPHTLTNGHFEFDGLIVRSNHGCWTKHGKQLVMRAT